LGAIDVVSVVDICAEIPLRSTGVNVQLSSDSVVIEVGNDGSSVDARRDLLQSLAVLSVVEGPRSVVSSSVELIESLELAVQLAESDGGGGLVHLHDIRGGPALAEHIVAIDLSSQLPKSSEDIIASLVQRSGRVSEALVGEVAALDLIVEVVIVETVPVGHLNEGGESIVFPVGHSVSNHEALKVRHPALSLVVSDVVVDLLNNLRHVDASVRLSRDVEFIVHEIRELYLEQVEHSLEVIGGGVVVVPLALSPVRAEREAHVGRTF